MHDLKAAVNATRTTLAHARQRCVSGQASQAEYEAARASYDEAKRQLADAEQEAAESDYWSRHSAGGGEA